LGRSRAFARIAVCVQSQGFEGFAVHLVAFNDSNIAGVIEAQVSPSGRAAGVMRHENTQSASGGEAKLTGQHGHETALGLVTCSSPQGHPSSKDLARQRARVQASDAVLQSASFRAAQLGGLPSGEQVKSGLLHCVRPVSASVRCALKGLNLTLRECV